jgi:sugar lactone lactonase YvrE
VVEIRRLEAERLTDVITHHGEGPVWSAADNRLDLVDMLAGVVVRLDPDTGAHDRLEIGSVAAALRPRTSGGIVVAAERSFVLIERDGRRIDLPAVWTDETVRFNDGGCDPDGRFYCGTMGHGGQEGRGTFYRLNIDHSVEPIFGNVTISNGFAFSPDGSRAYYVDTPTGRVDVFDYQLGELRNRRTSVASAGHPDGLCVDAAGNLWVAQFGGASVRQYTPAGEQLAEVAVAARQVTACTFGGPDLDTLYITTSRDNVPGGEDPGAGSVFAVQPGVRGLPTLAYAG